MTTPAYSVNIHFARTVTMNSYFSNDSIIYTLKLVHLLLIQTQLPLLLHVQPVLLSLVEVSSYYYRYWY